MPPTRRSRNLAIFPLAVPKIIRDVRFRLFYLPGVKIEKNEEKDKVRRNRLGEILLGAWLGKFLSNVKRVIGDRYRKRRENSI